MKKGITKEQAAHLAAMPPSKESVPSSATTTPLTTWHRFPPGMREDHMEHLRTGGPYAIEAERARVAREETEE